MDDFKPPLKRQTLYIQSLVGTFLWQSHDGKYWKIEEIENGQLVLRPVTAAEFAHEIQPLRVVMANQLNVVYGQEEAQEKEDTSFSLDGPNQK